MHRLHPTIISFGVLLAFVFLALFALGVAHPALTNAQPVSEVVPGDASQALTSSFVQNVAPGQQVSYYVGFRNIGTTTWLSNSFPSSTYYIHDTFRGGFYQMDCDVVAPGGSCFTLFTFSGASMPGTYSSVYSMCHGPAAFHGCDFGGTMTASFVVQVPPTATPAPTATPLPMATSTPLPTTVPAPNVGVQTLANQASRTFQVTITARPENCSPSNRLQSLRFTRLANATVELSTSPPTTVSAPMLVSLAAQPQTLMVTVRPLTQGVPTTVELTVRDSCGEWPTFVGGGPNSFQ
jgi:hypothetical protein